MSDAIGGVVNIALIVFFIIVIASYMAFNVNYEKAFNVKNEIVSLYEENNGSCLAKCKQKIQEYEKQIGYGKMNLKAGKNERCFNNYGYCVRGVEARRYTSSNSLESKKKYRSPYTYCYFRIRTQVLIDIPIIDNLMNLSVFQVTGQTKTLKLFNKNVSSTSEKDQYCISVANAG